MYEVVKVVKGYEIKRMKGDARSVSRKCERGERVARVSHIQNHKGSS